MKHIGNWFLLFFSFFLGYPCLGLGKMLYEELAENGASIPVFGLFLFLCGLSATVTYMAVIFGRRIRSK